MYIKLTTEQLAWQREVRNFLQDNFTSELKAEVRRTGTDEMGPLQREFLRKIVNKGWTGIAWPKEYGGQGKSVIEQFIFLEEFKYIGAPIPLLYSITMMGPTIIKIGTEENKEMWIPQISAGEVEFCLGYSEPNAGTDLASLSARAELIGDEWVINGVKMWITQAQHATHSWTAVRTDRNVKKHLGISVIIVPLDAPGVSIKPIYCWGHRTNEVVFDNVRVPKNYLVGEVNKGWNYINEALSFERVLMGNSADIRRMFKDLVQLCNHMVIDGKVLALHPSVRMRIAELAMDMEVASLFGWRAAFLINEGKVIKGEASIMKVFINELRAKLADWGMQILGYYGQLNREDSYAPLEGELEYLYRRAPFMRFGGGTSEVQRDIIARFGLGLPRK